MVVFVVQVITQIPAPQRPAPHWTQADLPGPTSAFSAQPGRALAGGGIDRPWVARWDGKSWTLLDAPIDAAPSALWGDAAGRFWLSSGRSILHYAA